MHRNHATLPNASTALLCSSIESEDKVKNHNENNEDVDQECAGSVPFEHTQTTLNSIPGETRAVTHCIEQQCQVELLQILEKAEAPDYLFNDITEWAS